MSRAALRIPEGLSFAALRLGREADGSVSFDTTVVAQICHASGLDPDAFAAHEDNLASLIVTWYAAHLAGGGAPDPVAEQIALEVRVEDHRRLN